MGGAVRAIGGAVTSVAKVAIAPITAPIAAVSSVVKGDNVASAFKNAALTATASMNPLAVAEAASGYSPTGFGAVALGSTDSADQNRFLISSAIGAAAAGGIAAAGGVGALGLGGGAAATGAAATGGLSTAGVAGAAATAAGTAAVGYAKEYLGPKPDNAVSGAAGGARSPASTSGGLPTNALLIAAGVLVLVLIVKRRG